MALALASRLVAMAAVVRGAYIVELAAGQNSSFLETAIQPLGRIDQELPFNSFTTVTITFPDLKPDHPAVDNILARLSNHPSVQNISPVHTNDMTVPDPPTPPPSHHHVLQETAAHHELHPRMLTPALPLSEHIMTQVDKLHDLNITGQGITVGIIDTGVDYTLPHLGKGCLVTRHVNFMIDDCARTPTDVMDCNGQGTSVASVLAREPGPYGPGVSPDVQLAVYRVGNDTVSDSIILSALHRAMHDRVPIVLMTFGSRSRPYGRNPVSRALADLVAANTAVIVGSGTEANGGAFLFNGNGDAREIVTVAAFKNARIPHLSVDQGAPPSLGSGAVNISSSWGPNYDMEVKPQFGAPGADVLKAKLSSQGGGFEVGQGTAMAAAHVAGAYALLAQVNDGRVDPELFARRLSATAQPAPFFNGTTLSGEQLAPVPQQGAGLVRIYDAAFSKTTISPASLSFNDTDSHDPEQPLEFTIHNQGHSQLAAAAAADSTSSDPVTYNISYTPALTFNALNHWSRMSDDYPFNTTQVSAELRFSTRTMTLEKDAQAVVQVWAVAPTAVNSILLPVWSGYTRVEGSDGTRLSIPYQGLSGSLRSTPVLRNGYALLLLRRTVKAYTFYNTGVFHLPASGNISVNANGDAITITNTTDPYPCPYLFAILGLATPQLRVFAVPVTRVAKKHTDEILYDWSGMREVSYSPIETGRNRGVARLGKTGWCGRLADGTMAPAGLYALQVRALRVRGVRDNFTDYDTDVSKPFTIDYQKPVAQEEEGGQEGQEGGQ